jgi:hypothetical protein
MRARHRQRPDARARQRLRERAQADGGDGLGRHRHSRRVRVTAWAASPSRIGRAGVNTAVCVGVCRIEPSAARKQQLVIRSPFPHARSISQHVYRAPQTRTTATHMNHIHHGSCMHFHHSSETRLDSFTGGEAHPQTRVRRCARPRRPNACPPRMVHCPSTRMVCGGTRRSDSSTVTPHSHRPGKRGGTDRATARGPPCRRAA